MQAALIGLGYWGKNYLRLLLDNKKVNLLMVGDVSNDALSRLEIPSGIIKTNVLEDIYNDTDIDFVIVTTPASTHYSIVKGLLESGKSVLVEKPLTLSSDEAKELIEMAYKSHLTLLVGHTYLYNDAYQFLKKFIGEGNLGKILYVYGERMGLGPIRSDASCIWDLAVHDISMALDIMGRMPSKTSAISSVFINKDMGISDFASIGFSYDSGQTFSFNVSWYSPSKVRTWKIVGEKAMVIFDDMDKEFPISIYEISANPNFVRDDVTGYYSLGKMFKPRIHNREPLKVLLDNFISLFQKSDSYRDELALNVVKLIENLEKGV